MPIQIRCGVCGLPITVSDEDVQMVQDLGGVFPSTHDVCPRDRKNQPRYHVKVIVERIPPLPDELDGQMTQEEWEALAERTELTSIGKTVEAVTFADGFDAITKALTQQWDKVAQMRNLVEANGD